MSHQPLNLSLRHASGLGLRRDFINEFHDQLCNRNGIFDCIDFFEVSPENWIGRGGEPTELLEECSQKLPCFAHGLSLSLGGNEPLDLKFIQQIRRFLATYNISIFSEHLSASSFDGQLYDLMPLPFTQSMASYLVERIQSVQNELGQQIALENISYYLNLCDEISEMDFFLDIIERSGAGILLDVNNVYVNSINHSYCAKSFIDSIPSNKIVYTHIAGHFVQGDVIIDTHGASVDEKVWDLLAYTYKTHGLKPTLLERDFNFPGLDEISKEINSIRSLQDTLCQKKSV